MDSADRETPLNHQDFKDSRRLQRSSNLRHFIAKRNLFNMETSEEIFFHKKWWRQRKRELKGYYEYLLQEYPIVDTIVCGLGIQPCISGPIAMLPENLNIDRLLSEYQPKCTDYFVVDHRGYVVSCYSSNTDKQGIIFDKERLIYLLGLLSKAPAENPDSINQEGWVRINSKIIRPHFNDYLAYINYLIFTGVIERSKNYVKGGHSYGYRYTEQYIHRPLKCYHYNYTRELIKQHKQKSTKEVALHHSIGKYDKGEQQIAPSYDATNTGNNKDGATVRDSIENYAAGDDRRAESECAVIGSLDKDFYNWQLEDDYPYLGHWYATGLLQIDTKRANDYAWESKEEKIRTGKWDINRNKTDIEGRAVYKNPITQYHCAAHNIYMMGLRCYQAHINENNHRLHSVLTSMPKGIRNFVSYGGETLVSIDIHNSQPYLACALFNKGFWHRESGLPLTLYSLPENIVSRVEIVPKGSSTNVMSIPEAIDELLEKEDVYSDIERYKERAGSGQLYESMAEETNKLITNGQQYTRKDAKILMMFLMFSSNNAKHSKNNRPDIIDHMKAMFAKNLYPNVAKVFKIVKHGYKINKDELTNDDKDNLKQHNRLALMLQAIEAEIILHRCCKRIWEEGNHMIPIFTIHDSIVTTVACQNIVRNVMEDELTKAIGVKPSLEAEVFSPPHSAT